MTYYQRRTFVLSYMVALLLISLVVLQLGQSVMIALLLIAITAIPPLMILAVGTADSDVIDTTDIDGYFSEVLSVVHQTLIATPTTEAAIRKVSKVLLEYDFGLHLETDVTGEVNTIEDESQREAALDIWLLGADEGDCIVAHKWVGNHLFCIFTIACIQNGEWAIDNELTSQHTTIYAKIMGAR